MSIDDVARVTKIQPRILERLEAGRFDGLPAEVFVRGFVRSFARCVGLAEDEALRRYAACASAPMTTLPEIPPLVAQQPLADGSIVAIPVPEVVAAPPPAPSRNRKKRRGKRNKRRTTAVGTPAEPTPVVVETAPEVVEEIPPPPEPIIETVEAPEPETTEFARVELAEPDPREEPIATETWQPKMPAPQPWVPWRRSGYVALASPSGSPPAAPSLVIDDADPDSAERVIEARAEKDPPRRSFLPPILLDREDRSARQGGLTLAVILLLIAATLTLSYLMRRPSASGDGMTMRDVPASYA